MITSVADLIDRGMRDRRLRDVVGGGGWYLVGSRAAGFDDALSDWDTIIIGARSDGISRDTADEIFGIERPAVQGSPTLKIHEQWRSVPAVDVEVLGPTACQARERRLAEWTFELRQAVPLAPSESAERYRARVAESFTHTSVRLAAESYSAFRQSRNEAVATLPRRDHTAQALTAAACIAHAARFWLLVLGQPHPAEKWLVAALRKHADAATANAMATAVDLRITPAERFDALWRLWSAVDAHAQEHGIDSALLAGSPFKRPVP